ncbi:MAG: HAD family phosphatase [Clostridia bacterium]|nr:HAD family phosphatase [Clostridia bacterium]
MKLLVLDIDGTLVNSKKEVTPATLAALSRWREAGHKIAIATGRPTTGVREVAQATRMAEEGGYILSYNGACISDAATGERVSGKFLPASLPAELAAYAADFPDLGLISYEGDTVLSLKEPDEYIVLEAVTINKMNLRTQPDFADYITFPVHKCLMTARPEVAEKHLAILQEKFGDRAKIFRSEPFFIEIMPHNVDKATSLDQFIPQIGITVEDVICVGDGFNDISMIRWAGLGVAMANARREVKEAADYITLSCDEDGVGALICKLLDEA